MSHLRNLLSKYSKPQIFGMIHVPALPGTPRNSLSVQQILSKVREEANIYARNEVTGIIVENMHDIPYMRGSLGPEIISTMTMACEVVNRVIDKRRDEFILGVQILAQGGLESLSVAHATGFDLIRSECFVYSHVADEGMMDANAGELLRFRKKIGAEDVAVITDVKKKHSSHAITSDMTIGDVAHAAEFFLADGIIVTGKSTGMTVDLTDFNDVKKSTSLPVFIGSGVTHSNVDSFKTADGLIIGSEFKKDGKWQNDLDEARIRRLLQAVKAIN